MKHLLFSLIILLSLSACQDKKNDAKAQATHDAKIAAQAKAEILAEIKAKKKTEKAQQKNTKLNNVGIAVNQGTIIIDTNKTKDFLQQIIQKMERQMQKISNDLQKGIIDAKEEGIQINDEHISIDLNKTRNLLEDWSKKIQVFVNKFDEVSNTVETNTSKGQ
jgi:Tfp pilus assembly protein PilV